MGFILNHFIVVETSLDKDLRKAHRKARELFPYVSPISPPAINRSRAFFIPPDGSKEGWLESTEGDTRRLAFLGWLDAEVRANRLLLSWVEVRYGDDGKALVTKSNFDKKFSKKCC